MRSQYIAALALTTIFVALPATGQTSLEEEYIASDWEFTPYIDERFKTATLATTDGSIAFHCGEVLGAEASLAEEEIFSAPGEVNLVISESLMGAYRSDFWEQRDLTGGSNFGETFDLPVFYYDEMGGTGWIARVPVDSALALRIGGGTEVVISPKENPPFSIDGRTAADKFTEMLEFCAAEPPQPLPSVEIDEDLSMQAIATFRTMCDGDWFAPVGAISDIDLTGDGMVDVLANPGMITCETGLLGGKSPNPCIDGMCVHYVYVRGLNSPIMLPATSIEPVEGQPGAIRLGLTPADCESFGQKPGCAARMRWTGTAFGTVGVE